LRFPTQKGTRARALCQTNLGAPFAAYFVKVAAAHFGKPRKPSFAKPGAAPLAKFASVYLAKLATASASLL
jgi:hypothetical protein